MTREPADVVAGAHAFVADLEAPVLDAVDRHHLERVLRIERGSVITVADGRGAWRAVRFGARLEAVGPIVHTAAPTPLVTVGFALLKGDRPELIVQKLTELGADRIVPFTAERCVVRWDGDRGGSHVARLRRVAREAAMQCRRARLPEVSDVVGFDTVAGEDGVALAERGGEAVTLSHPTLLVGPEGGWSPTERDQVPRTVSLGPHVLRAETAAIVAGALLSTLRGHTAT